MKEIPAGVVAMDFKTQSDLSVIKWSGKWPIPKIGDNVVVKMNDLGPGIVKEYVVVAGYLGLWVELTAPPKWFIKQNNGRNLPSVFYGRELK